MRAWPGVVTLAGVLVVAACGDDDVAPPTTAPAPPVDAGAPYPTLGATTIPLDGSTSDRSVVRALAVGSKDDAYVVFERRVGAVAALLVARFDPRTQTFGRALPLAPPGAAARAVHAEVLASGRVVVAFDETTSKDTTYRAITSDGETVTSTAVLATGARSTRAEVILRVSPTTDEAILLTTLFTGNNETSDLVRLTPIVGGVFRPVVDISGHPTIQLVAFSAHGLGLVCSSTLRGCQRLRDGVLEPFVALEGGPGCLFSPLDLAWAPHDGTAVVSGTCVNGKTGLAFVDELGHADVFDGPEDSLSSVPGFNPQSLQLADGRKGTLTRGGHDAMSVTAFDARGPLSTTRIEVGNEYYEPRFVPIPTRLTPDGKAYVVVPVSNGNGIVEARTWNGTEFANVTFPSARQNPKVLFRDWQAVVLPSGGLFALDVQLRHPESSGALDAFGLSVNSGAATVVSSRSFGPGSSSKDPPPETDGFFQPAVSLLASRYTDRVHAIVPGANDERSSFGWYSDRLSYSSETALSRTAVPRAIMRLDPLTGDLAVMEAPCARAAMLPVADRLILACEMPDGGIGILLPD